MATTGTPTTDEHPDGPRWSATPETGWLIELNDPSGSPGALWWKPGCWTADSTIAVRFSRKCDAEAVIRGMGFKKAIATEHQWG
jgi:hypothetical protein